MYVDINQCQSVVANFPNDIESIFVFGIFLCRQQNFFLYYLKKFFVSDENIFEKIYQLGRNGYVYCLPLYLPPFFCKKKWLLHQMQKSLALLSSSGNAEGELHSLLILYLCKITKSIDTRRFIAFLIHSILW